MHKGDKMGQILEFESTLIKYRDHHSKSRINEYGEMEFMSRSVKNEIYTSHSIVCHNNPKTVNELIMTYKNRDESK